MANTWTVHAAEWRCVQMLFPFLALLLMLSEGPSGFRLWGEAGCFVALAFVNGWGVFLLLNTCISSSAGKSAVKIALVILVTGTCTLALGVIAYFQLYHATCGWTADCRRGVFVAAAVFCVLAVVSFAIDTGMTVFSWNHYRVPWEGTRRQTRALRHWRRRRQRRLTRHETILIQEPGVVIRLDDLSENSSSSSSKRRRRKFFFRRKPRSCSRSSDSTQNDSTQKETSKMHEDATETESDKTQSAAEPTAEPTQTTTGKLTAIELTQTTTGKLTAFEHPSPSP